MNLDELTRGLPKTELVYLRQMRLQRTEAIIVRAVPEKKSHAYLVLDRTIFHPKGGGQPSDRGAIRMGDATLSLKKAIYHRGAVVHWVKLTTNTVPEGEVTCELDWQYRYLIMRRHTAAHLLDHCLAKAIGSSVRTTDSWLDNPCYVGYAGAPPDMQTLRRVELLANQMITQGADVKLDFLDPSKGKAILGNAPNYERLPNLEEIRTVTIDGCEPIPCGGTHTANIKEIGSLHALRTEKMPDDSFRLHFSTQE